MFSDFIMNYNPWKNLYKIIAKFYLRIKELFYPVIAINTKNKYANRGRFNSFIRKCLITKGRKNEIVYLHSYNLQAKLVEFLAFMVNT